MEATKKTSKPRPILNEHLKLVKTLGEGSTSRVYLAKVLKDSTKPDLNPRNKYGGNKYVAVKVFRESYMSENQYRSQKVVKKEIEVIKKMDHENIVKMHSWGSDGKVIKPSGREIKDLFYIVMEYVEGSLLFDLVSETSGIGEDRARILMH